MENIKELEKLNCLKDVYSEMKYYIELGKAVDKAYQNGYIVAYGINRHAEKFDIDTTKELLEWAEGVKR